MEVNDIVVVVETTSLPDSFLGQYGMITALNTKVTVEFFRSVGNRGSMSHTASIRDLEVVGKSAPTK